MIASLRLLVFLAAVCLSGAAPPVRADVDIPPLRTRVTDLTGTLSQQQRADLEAKLAAFESRKGSQIAVLMLPTTEPETIEQYSIRVAEKWKVGRKRVDDGAILVVALKDRALRLEVGYGLEGVLSDLASKRIISEIIVPRFKSGDIAGGIDAGVTRMMAVVDGEPLPPPRSSTPGGNDGMSMEELLGLGFVLVFVVGGIVRSIFGRTLGSGILGAIGAGAAWLILGSAMVAGIVGVVVGVLSLFGGMANVGGGRGGWSSGGWSSGGGGLGGGSSSWGGGGGGFGGGGASGRW